MADLLFLATIVAFFALMVVFVRVCERVVGQGRRAVGTDVDLDRPGHRRPHTITEEVPA